ncbi:MAG: dihydroorotase [Armatimonadetes bacterium]|nr:dihydroorotase [Armatimonadota bacterium]
MVLNRQGHFAADVGVHSGKIASIGDLSSAKAAERVSVAGLTAMPGVIDSHVHFREPGAEYKEDLESGTRAAIAGGVTSVFEMPNTSPTTTNAAALADKLQRAKGRAWCHHAFWVGATPENAEHLGELEALPGTPGVKLFMGASTGSLLVPDDPTIRTVLQHGSRRVAVHSEDHARLTERKALMSKEPTAAEHPFLRDSECARIATNRLLKLSAETGRPVHILHTSTLDELPLIDEARAQGLKTTCEITPHHLWFAAPEVYERLGSLVQMNPPVRGEDHRAALRAALKRGFFDTAGSDHAPHLLEEKALPYPQSPSGMPGVQTLLPILLTLALDHGCLDLSEVLKLLCHGPAQTFRIQGKGELKEGSDADIAVVDLSQRRVVDKAWLKSKCGWSPYEGERLRGFPVHTLVAGEFAMREGDIIGQPRGVPIRFEPGNG